MHPILFQFGPVEIRFYGLMYVIAIFLGLYLIKREVKRKGIGLPEEDIINFILWTVVGGILGARAYYVIFNWDYYSFYPMEIPAIWHGGLAIHGGLIGGFLVAYWFLRRRHIPFWRMADAVAPSIILGQALGRFGNFMNGDAHGIPTDLPWGILFPEESIAGSDTIRRYGENLPLHPTMLYEMLINLSIFSILWFVLRKHVPVGVKQGKDYKDGFIFASYIILYSIGRLFVETFRADSLMFGPVKAAQLVSILLIAVVSFILFKKRLWKKEG